MIWAVILQLPVLRPESIIVLEFLQLSLILKELNWTMLDEYVVISRIYFYFVLFLRRRSESFVWHSTIQPLFIQIFFRSNLEKSENNASCVANGPTLNGNNINMMNEFHEKKIIINLFSGKQWDIYTNRAVKLIHYFYDFLSLDFFFNFLAYCCNDNYIVSILMILMIF